MNKLHFLLFTLIGTVLLSCSTGNYITSDYEREADLYSYKSYDILAHNECYQDEVNPINKQRITRAINKEMGNMGYIKEEEPDLLVSWYVVVKDVKEVDLYLDYYGWWRYHNSEHIYYYTEGTLVIDLIDRKKKQVVWHGKTSGRVYEEMPKVEEKINKAIQAMFKKYLKDMKEGKGIAYN